MTSPVSPAAGTAGFAPAASAGESAAESAAYRKVTWRLIPFLMLCYVVAYLDRVNVGFAKLQMLNDLQFSETVYGLGAGVFNIGMFTAIPYACAVIAMLLFGRSADRMGERRWHLVVPMLLGAAGLVGSALAGGNTTVAVAFLALAAAGVISSAPMFWSLPTAFLGGTAAAAGIAAINSVGNLAGFASPYLIGWLKDLTQSTNLGMYVLAAVLVAGCFAVLSVPARLVNR
jgi:nitrate/nitrite transporter NarK